MFRTDFSWFLLISRRCSSKYGLSIFDFSISNHVIFDVLVESGRNFHGRKRAAEIIFVTFEIASLAVRKLKIMI